MDLSNRLYGENLWSLIYDDYLCIMIKYANKFI